MQFEKGWSGKALPVCLSKTLNGIGGEPCGHLEGRAFRLRVQRPWGQSVPVPGTARRPGAEKEPSYIFQVCVGHSEDLIFSSEYGGRQGRVWNRGGL